jgi:hypothetical protein
MRAISRAITLTLGAGIFSALFVSNALAGCGELTSWQGPFQIVQQATDSRLFSQSAKPEDHSARDGMPTASIVGMWKVQFISLGNGNHNPSIPDGALIDFGYGQWHSDGTEIFNSGGRAPATQNFCLGVWGRTGYLAYELNHFALSYDAPSGSLNGTANIREQVTLSPSGDSYTGTFTIDVYAPNGSHVDHLAGTITGTRLTVDSTLPGAIANQ